MIKKLKLGFLLAVLSVAISASAANLNYTDATHISIGGYDYVISAGSAATSLVVSGNTIAVLVPTSSTFTLTSASGSIFNNDASLTSTCSGSTSSITVIGDSATTVTITPFVGTSCSTGGSGGLTSGGGSTTTTTTTTTTSSSSTGSSSGSSPVILNVTSVTPTAMTISGCDNRTTGFSTVTGQSCSGNTATFTMTTPTVIAGCNGTVGFSTVSGMSCATNGTMMTSTTSYNFGTVTLKNGSKGSAVMELQRFLNRFLNLGLVVDGKLGPKTIAVIKKWQLSKGLVADGLIGPKTKAMMNTEAELGY